MSVHRIRLLGPWEYRWHVVLQETVPAAVSGTTTIPQTWQQLFGSVSGRAAFSRKFHRPTNLEPHERVFLVLTAVRGAGRVELNSVSLGEFTSEGECVEFDATDFLQAFNMLSIDLTFDPDSAASRPGGLLEPVVMEIRSNPDYAARLAEAAVATNPMR
jgi:hypothetical protein